MQPDELKRLHERGAAMLAAAHQGPWAIGDKPCFGYRHVRQDPKDWNGMGYQHICSVPADSDEFKGDAMILAASWSMLSAAVAGLGAAIEEIHEDPLGSDVPKSMARAEAFAVVVRAALGEAV